MTKYVKFVGTKFADTLGIATTALSQKLLGKGGADVLLGGLGSDKIKGGKGDDWILGGAGNDDIDGGQGLDIAVYAGRFSEYSLAFKSNLDGKVEDQVAGRDGTDTLKKVEFLKFSDGVYDIANDTFLAFNRAPTLATPAGIAYDDTAAHDVFAPAAAALSATDPDGDTLIYSLGGGVADNSLAGYDVSKSSTYGTMYLNSASGAYRFVPASATIEALKTSASVDFTFTAFDGEFSDSRTLTVALNGVNDVATITGLATGPVTEDTIFTAGGAVTVNDRDSGDQQFQTPAPLSGNYGYFVFSAATGSWEYVLANGSSAVQTLGADDVRHDTLAVTSADGTAHGTIDITVHGANDAPVLEAPVGSEPVFGADDLTLSATLAFSEIDLTDVHTVEFTHIGHDFIGDFTAELTTDSIDGAPGSLTATYHLTLEQFLAAGGDFQAEQRYRVTIRDNHGGASSQDIVIPLAEILEGGGGGSAQPPTFTGGDIVGQLVDNPNVLNPPTSSTDLVFHGTLFFSDPDGGGHHAFVDLAHAFILGHTLVDSHGVPQPVMVHPITTSTGVWQVFAQEPNQVSWSYTLPETVIRSMAQGETQSMMFPIIVSEDGVGQSTQLVRIDLFGTTEVPFLLPPETILPAGTDISPYLLPPNALTHVQSQNFSITEDVLVTGSTSHHTLSGTIAFADPDRLDHPTVSMTLLDPGVPLSADVQSVRDGFSYTVEQYGNYGMIHWAYDVQDSELDFLPQNSSLTVAARFDVGELAGASSSTVNVTLHGSNDAVAIPGGTTTLVTLSLADGNASGGFTFFDPDWYPDAHNVEFVPRNADSHGVMFGGTGVEDGLGGSEPVSWSYTTNGATGTLVPGQHDIFDVLVHDNSGSIATHAIDIWLV